MIIGKNVLTGSTGNWNTDAQCQLLGGAYAPTLTASQQLEEYHFGYGDVGGSGTCQISVALYDVSSGFNGATLIPNTTQTFTIDNSSLSGDQWLSITGLSVDLSSLSGTRVAVMLTSPTANGAGILLSTVSGTDRNKSIISTTPPSVHNTSGTSSNTFALYAVTGTAVPTFNVDSVSSGPYYPGDTVTLTTSNANASGKTLSIAAGSITVDSQSTTEMTFTVPDPKTFGTKTTSYSTDIEFTATDGADTDTFTLQISPETGHDYTTILSATGIFSNDTGISVGDKVYGYFSTGTGNSAVEYGALNASVGSVYTYWIQDDTDGVWGESADEVFGADSTYESFMSWIDNLPYEGSTTEKLIQFLRSKGHTGGMTEMMYEYLKTVSSDNSHSERYVEWKNRGFN